MTTHELTDPTGGALTVTHNRDGVWVTATEDRDEVTVGPFPSDALAGAVTRAAPLRYSIDPADTDGGMAADAIEKETVCGFCHGIADGCGQLAPDGVFACTRREGHDLPHVACCPDEHMLDTWPEKCGLDPVRRETEVVSPERARSLVQENTELRARIGQVEEARDLYRRDTLTEERLHGEARRFALAWKEAARKMFLERRTLISYAEMCKGSVERAAEAQRSAEHFHAAYKQESARIKRYREERGESEDALREAQEVVKSLRAMTPRDHLDAAFADGYRRKGGIIPQGTQFIAFLGDRPGEGVRVSVAPKDLPEIEDHCERRLLDPEPPSRPEGAAELESILSELVDTDLPFTNAGRADLLAARGVRVVTEEEL